MFCVSGQVNGNKHRTEVLGKGAVENSTQLKISSSMSYSLIPPCSHPEKGFSRTGKWLQRARMVREVQCLSSRNGSKSLSSLKICEKYVGEGSLFCFQNKNKRVSSQL